VWARSARQAFLAEYPAGLRVIVHTANLLFGDCCCKTQGAWVQDFPPKARRLGSFTLVSMITEARGDHRF